MINRPKEFEQKKERKKGQIDKDVQFHAKTFSGTVFVTKQGEIVYSLLKFKDTNKEDRKDRKFKSSGAGNGCFPKQDYIGI